MTTPKAVNVTSAVSVLAATPPNKEENSNIRREMTEREKVELQLKNWEKEQKKVLNDYNNNFALLKFKID